MQKNDSYNQEQSDSSLVDLAIGVIDIAESAAAIDIEVETVAPRASAPVPSTLFSATPNSLLPEAVIGTFSETISVPALICHQGKKTFYYFKLNATQLARVAYVSRREHSDEGYQRLLDKRRAEAIMRYIEGGSTLPNNIVLSFDDPSVVHFDDATNLLTFPNNRRAAWVIDGQHRLFGADLLNRYLFGQEIADTYEFTVSAFVGLDVVEQARIFLDINSYQEGVDKSLLYDLLDMFETDEASPEFHLARASDIVKRLNREPESPFFERISRTKDRVRGTISQATFVDALVTHLERGGVLSQTSEYKFSLEEQYKVIFNYFTAVYTNLPELWFNDTVLLTKTTGFNALMLALPTIFHQTVRRFDNFELSSVEKVLSPLRLIPWHSKELEGQQGTIAARKLAEAIRTAVISSLDQEDSQKPKQRLAL